MLHTCIIIISLIYVDSTSVLLTLHIFKNRYMGVGYGEIQAIHWMYPIIGLPQAPPPKSSPGKDLVLKREEA
jgi:hypothetical protein